MADQVGPRPPSRTSSLLLSCATRTKPNGRRSSKLRARSRATIEPPRFGQAISAAMVDELRNAGS
jgi:hypothetical protein